MKQQKKNQSQRAQLSAALASFIFAIMAVTVTSAHAGTFRCVSYSNAKYDCASLLREIVTDDFTNKFPSKKFEISLISSSALYDDGKSSGVALVGVVPAGSNAVPKKRFNSYFSDQNIRKLADVHADELEAVQSAVRDMVQSLAPSTLSKGAHRPQEEIVAELPVAKRQSVQQVRELR